MKRLSVVAIAAVCAALACCVAPAQTVTQMTPTKHEAGVPSTTLTLTGADGTTKTLTVAELMRLPQTTATVMNSHTHQQETYGGVTVKDLLALLAPAKIVPVAGTDGMKTKVSSRMMVVVARGTDNFRVVLTLCDTDPSCRSGQAMVADTVDGRPLTTDGAFKLILTEDKTPGRWVRNLDALTVKNLGAM